MQNRNYSGFSLVELMIALLLSTLLMHSLLTGYFHFIQLQHSTKQHLEIMVNRQQAISWIIAILNQAGQHNVLDSNNRLEQGRLDEAAFIHSTPLVFTSVFAADPDLTSREGRSDSLVINTMAKVGCNGQRFNYQNQELFHAVNELFVANGELRCRSYDGRYLMARKPQSERPFSVSILKDVASLNLEYLVRHPHSFQWQNRNDIDEHSEVSAVRLELWLLKSEPTNKLTQRPQETQPRQCQLQCQRVIIQHALTPSSFNKVNRAMANGPANMLNTFAASAAATFTNASSKKTMSSFFPIWTMSYG